MNALWAVQGGGGNHPHHFANLVVAYLDLPEGKWAVFAKGIISNFDGDYQNASVALDFEGHPPRVLDRIQDRLQPGQHEAFSLLGAVAVDQAGGTTVRLVANTYDGYVEFGSIIALPIEGFVRSVSEPYPG